MKKYIDAEGVMRACYDSFLKTGNKAYREIFALVEAVPAADVEEVVRCKDCKYGDTDMDEIGRQFYKCIGIHYGSVSPTDYCSYGEREE